VVGGVGLLYLRCLEKCGKIVREGVSLRRWVGKYVGCDGDDLNLFLHLGEGVGVLLHMIQSDVLVDFEIL